MLRPNKKKEVELLISHRTSNEKIDEQTKQYETAISHYPEGVDQTAIDCKELEESKPGVEVVSLRSASIESRPLKPPPLSRWEAFVSFITGQHEKIYRQRSQQTRQTFNHMSIKAPLPIYQDRRKPTKSRIEPRVEFLQTSSPAAQLTQDQYPLNRTQQS
jgi:hypothetical protein